MTIRGTTLIGRLAALCTIVSSRLGGRSGFWTIELPLPRLAPEASAGPYTAVELQAATTLCMGHYKQRGTGLNYNQDSLGTHQQREIHFSLES